jgi:hypothetical protein
VKRLQQKKLEQVSASDFLDEMPAKKGAKKTKVRSRTLARFSCAQIY